MKKLSIIGLIIIIFIAVCYFLPPRPYNFDDCIELGLCAEGLELKDNGKSFVMTKEYCLKTNHIWYEDGKACNMRKFSN